MYAIRSYYDIEGSVKLSKPEYPKNMKKKPGQGIVVPGVTMHKIIFALFFVLFLSPVALVAEGAAEEYQADEEYEYEYDDSDDSGEYYDEEYEEGDYDEYDYRITSYNVCYTKLLRWRTCCPPTR